MEQGSKARLVTCAVLAVVFVSGLVLGAAVEGNLAAPPEVAAEEPSQGDEPTPRRVPMYEQVGPTAEQSVRIDQIVEDYQARRDAARNEARALYDARARELILETRAAILGVLEGEQAEAYRALLDEADRRRAEREDGADRS